MKALILGGAKSGKTRHALSLATELGARRVYLATATALDDEMQTRITRHKAERGEGWRTIEAALAIDRHLAQPGEVVLVDCLTLWVTNLMMETPERESFEDHFASFTAALAEAKNDVVVVSNEVGFGIVPDNALARRFRELAGSLAQQVAEVCDRVELVCAGLPIRVKG